MKKLLLSLLTLIGFASFAYAEEVTFDFANNDYGMERITSGNAYTPTPVTISEGDVTVTCTADDSGFRLWTDGIRFYNGKNGKMAISTPGASLNKIEMTVKSGVKFVVEDVTTGTYLGSGTSISWTADETADPVDLITFAYTASKNVSVVSVTVTYTPGSSVVTPPASDITYRRYSTDGASRYYDNISYTVNGETKEVYSVSDPRTESYYVAPQSGQWQTEGAYIDFKDKVIEVPADAENFTMILKSTDKINDQSSGWSSKWNQNAIFVDWNQNGQFNDEGETNGVINLGVKPNQAGGALVITASGETDVITLPAGVKAGDRYSMLIAMNEPKGLDGKGDLWDQKWEWTKEIFSDNVCTLVNGQAYELTVLITAPLTAPKPAELAYSAATCRAITGAENEFPTLANPNELAVTYSSSNEEVATVNENGEVTLVGAGTATITASSEAGNGFEAGTASYTLTVVKGCANLAEFIAATPNKNDVAVMNGNVNVVYVNGAYVYVKDETASSLIYKFNLGYEAGDIIPGGWEGKNSVYNGLYEIVPTGDMPDALAGEAPEIARFDGTVTTDMMNQVIKLHYVEFAEATPETKTSFTGTLGDQTLTFYNSFTIPGVEAGAYDVVAAVSVYNTTLQLYPISYTVATPDPLTFRRKYTSSVARHYNEISYTVNGDFKVLYSVSDPRTDTQHNYYVKPVMNQWQTEGAYVDFRDMVIKVPAEAENFTITLKTNKNAASSLWSQNAIFVDWNSNGRYTDEGETNGVINIDSKPNQPGGGLVATAEGESETITIPAGIKPGTYSLLIAMNEPKGLDGTEDLWEKGWDWTKEIFANNVCSLINGQAHELVVEILAPEVKLEPAELSYSAEIFRAVTGTTNEFPTLSNPNELTVTYASSDETVATVNENGEVILVGAGTTTITATSAQTDKYEAGSASYTLNVAKGCATLAEFLAATPEEGNTAVMLGDVTVVYVNASYIYIKDATASSLIYKYNLGYEAGDVIPGGWEGKNDSYFGLYEIAPVGTMPEATAGEAPAIPVYEGEVTGEMMNQVVKLRGVTFEAKTPATKSSFTGTYGDKSYTFYNTFLTPETEAGVYDVVVAVAKRYDNVQLYPIEYTPFVEDPMTFRRYSSDGSDRYYDEISYIINGETKELYKVSNPRNEDYYVAAKNGQWQEDGAYIDFTDKVIKVPSDVTSFTMVLRSTDGANWSSKWSQNAVFVDWNNNGVFTDEGETNGVINLGVKANQPGGGRVVTAEGETDVITLPEGLENGQRFNMLIAMNEPKGTDGRQDLWDQSWEWTKEIFSGKVCSVVNGQVYGVTVLISEPLSAIDNINADVNADTEYYTIQGVKVAAENLTPGFYVARQGNKTFKILVK